MAARLTIDARDGGLGKALGQNFLRSDSVIRSIIEAAHLSREDSIWEIGCGDGALSTHIIDEFPDYRIIEYDRDIVAAAQEQWPGVNLSHHDATKPVPDNWGEPTVLISNLPYASSTAIMRQFFVPRFQSTRMVLMFQREVADRILGRSAGAKGPLWVLSAMLYDLKRVAQVPPSAFRPAPKVHSSVIAFAPRDDDAAVLARRQLPTYWHILTQAFGNRRKMLRNTLKAYDAPVVREYDTKRAEELSLDDWQRVFDACVGLKFS